VPDALPAGEDFMKTPHILVIEDDRHIAELISLYLARHQFRYTLAEDGRKGLASFYADPPDLIVLDIMMPEMDGWMVCAEIRDFGSTPVIMVTGKGESVDKLRGFSLGVDDYIVKPFDPKEMVARIKAVLRRGNPSMFKEEIKFPGLTINLNEYRVFRGETEVNFPPKEIELLHFLATHPNQVFTREQLLNQIWGLQFEGDSRTVDVHIKRVRDKVSETGGWRIVTVWGVGYKFEVNDGCRS
jgi:DNA-binding response OmpR family regulator